MHHIQMDTYVIVKMLPNRATIPPTFSGRATKLPSPFSYAHFKPTRLTHSYDHHNQLQVGLGLNPEVTTKFNPTKE